MQQKHFGGGGGGGLKWEKLYDRFGVEVSREHTV